MPQRRFLMRLIVILGGLAAVIAIVWVVRNDAAPAPAPGAMLEQSLEGLEALAREFPPPGDEPLAWPRDHGAKPGQFAEYWLFAGVLDDDVGGRHGFQLAIYRVAVQREPPARESAWATRDLYRARFSIEPRGAMASGREQLSRGALGLAGADEGPATAWVGDWRFTAYEGDRSFRLEGGDADDAFALRLSLPDTRPFTIDGQAYRGYWWPGLEVAGTLRIGGRDQPVSGRAMLDRLWGRTLPVGRGQQALARVWFEAEDGRAVRCMQLRRRAGGGTPVMQCLASPDVVGDIELEPESRGWDVVAGIRYPLRWTLRLAEADAPLRIAPLASARPASLDGAWSGAWSGIVVVGATEDTGWGLLELSNFAPP